MRINQSLKPTYNELPHPLGAVQTAGGVGRVMASSVPHLDVGDWVEGMLGWQTHAKVHHSVLRKLDPTLAPPSTALGVQGMLARDYLHRMDEMLKVVGPMVQQGQIHFEETVVEGFEQLPAALQSLFIGDHRGKLIVSARP